MLGDELAAKDDEAVTRTLDMSRLATTRRRWEQRRLLNVGKYGTILR